MINKTGMVKRIFVIVFAATVVLSDVSVGATNISSGITIQHEDGLIVHTNLGGFA